MVTKWDSGVVYSPYIPIVFTETTKSRSLALEGWSHEIEYHPICHGIEIYSNFPMPDNVRKELSNIPYSFKLTGFDLYKWISNKFILISIQKEIDEEVLKEIETGLRQV